MTKTRRTKRLGIVSKTLFILSILLTIGPALGFAIQGMIEGTLVTHKLVLMASCVMYIIFTAMAVINKTVNRSKIWIILIALYFILDEFAVCVLMIGLGQIIDEVLVTPIHHLVKNKYITNKEMDKRGV